MKTPQQIQQLFEQRRTQRGTFINEMDDVRRHYYGEITVPLPELDKNERPAVANLFALGIDQMGMRVASVTPVIHAPAIRPGFKNSEELALNRKKAVEGWLEMGQMKMKTRRRARFLVAYACAPVTISPKCEDPSPRRIPFWRVRNPLVSYPAPMVDADNIEPDDCIFHDQRPLSWLKECYPDRVHYLHKGSNPEGMFDILEYVDAEETVIICVGSTRESTDMYGRRSYGPADGIADVVELDRIPNRMEICPVVFPGRLTLDRPQSTFSQMIGMYQRAAKLDALQLLAVFRGVFGDEWVESIPNAPSKPRIVQYADGKQGRVGIIENGRHTQSLININQGAFQALDSLERSQRLTAGIPAEFGGESPTNVRTARRGSLVLGNNIDMPIQEYQEVLERSFDAEIHRAIKAMKVYYGKTPSMFFIPNDGQVTKVDYTPMETFETDHVFARYALPGYDAEGASIEAGQKIGEGVWSAQRAMELDPSIPDVQFEINRIQVEGLRRALLAGMEAQAQQGQLDPHTMAMIARRMADGKTMLEVAVDDVHRAMQAAQQAAQEGQEGAPGPEAAQPGMQGLAAGGGGMPTEGAPGQPGTPALPPGQQQTPGQTAGEAGETTVPQPSMGATDLMKLLASTHPPARAA